MKDKLHRSACALSGGQQQWLRIARALAVDPEVPLLDEPSRPWIPSPPRKSRNGMQPAARAAGYTGFFLLGRFIEFSRTAVRFKTPARRETEHYITGRFG